MWKIDPVARTTQIVSCEGYEEKFLKKMGFANRDSCVELNLALHRQYTDECLKQIKSSNDEAANKKFVESCVYHSFEKDETSLSSEYLIYKRNGK